MAHEVYHRTVPGARTAVLFLHGIVGSPEHFRKVIDLQSMVPDTCSVHNIRYPGHGGTVRDFGSSSMKQWKAHVWAAFDALAQSHEQVIVVGHSMGTLFAIELAIENPKKIPCLFLLQSPMKVALRWFGVKNLLRIPFGKIRLDDPYGASMLVACGVTPTKKIWQYIPWCLRMLELFGEISKTRKQLDHLQVRALAFQSQKDELVSNRSAKILRRNANVEVVEMPAATHFYYPDREKEKMRKAFDCICESIA